MAHAYGADAIDRAVRCGVRSIEHGNLIDAEAAATVVSNGAFVVPTMVAYEGLERHGREAGVDAWRLAKNAEVRAAGLGAFEILRAAGAESASGATCSARSTISSRSSSASGPRSAPRRHRPLGDVGQRRSP